MKRGFLIFVLTLVCLCSGIAQTHIQYRKILENGNLSTMTEELTIKENGQQDLGIALMYETVIRESADRSGYSLVFTVLSYSDSWVIPMDGKLLIKTSSGKVISLSQIVSDTMYMYNPDSGYDNVLYLKSAFHHTDKNRNKNVYRKFGKYPISVDDLKAIASEGIIKIRLETTGDIIECEYPSAKNTLRHLYTSLSSTIDPYRTF